MRGQLHVVMGGAGAIGRAVINALQERQLAAVAVERSKTVPGVTTIRADLLDAPQTLRATAFATHVYLCVGIPYSTRAAGRVARGGSQYDRRMSQNRCPAHIHR